MKVGTVVYVIKDWYTGQPLITSSLSALVTASEETYPDLKWEPQTTATDRSACGILVASNSLGNSVQFVIWRYSLVERTPA